VVTTLLAICGSAAAQDAPYWLPRYDLEIKVDVAGRNVQVRERITWTNHHQRPTRELVFNAHSHYEIPKKDIGFLAKTVELLRLSPSESLSFDGPACQIDKVIGVSPGLEKISYKPNGSSLTASPDEMFYRYQDDNPTALVVPLPRDVYPGESVTIELDFTMHLPQKQGRWGQWNGVTTLAQWLPVLAYFDNNGWHPAPFIPWHQPFFNEAGVYTTRITVPREQKLACTGSIEAVKDLDDGWQENRISPICARDFALICSDRFQEHVLQVGNVRLRCLALPQHEFYAQEMLKCVSEALPVYQKWFGPYPYPQFTIVESYFGWNGNECGGLVMIDERMFDMPHIGRNYLDYLISHEFCHQWWYNVVGTNGYAETWMDEGLATYFSHRLITQKLGKNNELLELPGPLKWLPNIHRDDFRNYGMLGTVARGEATPTVQPMEKFGHLANLSAMTYDRGSKIVGMIEERMGETAFLDFMHLVYKKYQFQILLVEDYRRELEMYTGRSWKQFFDDWLYSTGMCDWAVENVEVREPGESRGPRLRKWLHPLRRTDGATQVTVHLSQRGQCNEPTTLGFRLEGDEGYQVRIPIRPEIPVMQLDEYACTVRNTQVEKDGKVTTQTEVEILLPSEPRQISVDPDGILVDREPVNNHWKPMCRWRFTPLYTQAEETDVTAAYDRWNFIFGPWVYSASYVNPWFTRSPMAGLRAGAYRTQEFYGGAYLAYRSDDRNIVAGVDATWEHIFLPQLEIGINAEKSLATLSNIDIPASRAAVYARYILMQTSSLYLPPFEYVEVFNDIQNRSLPNPIFTPPGANLFNDQVGMGVHYHKFMLTPYWDPEGGLAFDATFRGGIPVFGADGFEQAFGQVSFVKYTPDPFGWLEDTSWLSWLAKSRWAFRLAGAIALPDNGLFFALGGGNYFRGFDLNQRQGAATWVGSLEWRVPVFTRVEWDFVDHVAGVRNVFLVPFSDVGNAYYKGHPEGPLAVDAGLGLRVDVAWLGLIERTMLRLDVAKAINSNAPVQFWVGVQHPF
jgi:hypothetical protein